MLRLTADGTPTREIAEWLHLSVATVRNHLSAITRTTGGRNRIDAIRIAVESGWVRTGQVIEVNLPGPPGPRALSRVL